MQVDSSFQDYTPHHTVNILSCIKKQVEDSTLKDWRNLSREQYPHLSPQELLAKQILNLKGKNKYCCKHLHVTSPTFALPWTNKLSTILKYYNRPTSITQSVESVNLELKGKLFTAEDMEHLYVQAGRKRSLNHLNEETSCDSTSIASSQSINELELPILGKRQHVTMTGVWSQTVEHKTTPLNTCNTLEEQETCVNSLKFQEIIEILSKKCLRHSIINTWKEEEKPPITFNKTGFLSRHVGKKHWHFLHECSGTYCNCNWHKLKNPSIERVWHRQVVPTLEDVEAVLRYQFKEGKQMVLCNVNGVKIRQLYNGELPPLDENANLPTIEDECLETSVPNTLLTKNKKRLAIIREKLIEIATEKKLFNQFDLEQEAKDLLYNYKGIIGSYQTLMKTVLNDVRSKRLDITLIDAIREQMNIKYDDTYLSDVDSWMTFSRIVFDWSAASYPNDDPIANGTRLMQQVTLILDKKTKKQNTIYLWGETNCGKTLWTKTIEELLLNVGRVTMKVNAYQQFPFNEMPNRRLGVWNEFSVSTGSVHQILEVMEGTDTCVNIKHKDLQLVKRTPIIITNNKNFITQIGNKGKAITPAEKEALLQRMLLFENLKTIPWLKCIGTKRIRPTVWKYIIEGESIDPMFGRKLTYNILNDDGVKFVAQKV